MMQFLNYNFTIWFKVADETWPLLPRSPRNQQPVSQPAARQP